MKKYSKTVLALLLPFTTSVWAENYCDYLHIQVANATNYMCQLISSDVIHGSLLNPPPAALFPGASRSFFMSQTVYGPHITLRYRCGDRDVVTFTSQQNYCALEAGNISAIVDQPLAQNINVTYIKEGGSYHWDTPGMISWILSPRR